MAVGFVDIHCHLLSGIDDGADDPNESLAMARMAVADGIETIICTPHQLGNYRANTAEIIRKRVGQLQRLLRESKVPLRVLPGADVRIEADMIEQLQQDHVLTLGDQRRHVLLELPHELYLPLESIIVSLNDLGMQSILSHPERNQGILRQPSLLKPLVKAGCLMQVTAGSLAGTFGPMIQRFAQSIVSQGLCHFIATDAHGPTARRPRIRGAYQIAADLVGPTTADMMCIRNPSLVARGETVPGGVLGVNKRGIRGWLGLRRAS
ncbi:MAG: CpsB/CapC family capsule biosynthesis tyrosine phosphatase [Pirellulales bacterium]|nr:CpsB/CapC family capsule biosynthesis tyrosine phosphatase [Pirellulales bacterium]